MQSSRASPALAAGTAPGARTLQLAAPSTAGAKGNPPLAHLHGQWWDVNHHCARSLLQEAEETIVPWVLHLASAVVARPLAVLATALPIFVTRLHFAVCTRPATPRLLFPPQSGESEHRSGEVQ